VSSSAFQRLTQYVDELAAKSALFRQLWQMRFYGSALLLQKGLPSLLLPYLVLVFGRDTYASYILFYTTTQVIATVAGMGVPLALVPLWHRWPDPEALVKRSIGIIGLATPVAFLFLVGSAALLGISGPPPISTIEAAIWICVFAAIFNLNTLAIAVARSLGRDRSFFLASCGGAVAFLTGLVLAWQTKLTDLRALVAINGLALGASAMIMLRKRSPSDGGTRERATIDFKSLLASSLPLAANAVLVLLAMSVDKWTARRFFPGEPFSQYVIDYQAALTIAFVPVVTGMHLAPRLAAAAAKGSLAALREDLAATRLITFTGALAMAGTMAIYARISGLGLGSGYWLIVGAFLLESQYTISSNIATANQRFRAVMGVTAVALAILVLVLAAAAVSGDWFVLYFGPLAYEVALLTGISWVNRRVGRFADRACASEDSPFPGDPPPLP
jgi:O-antigen/teichoic acid export membrane protein